MTAAETKQLIEARKDIQYMQEDIKDLKEAIKNLPDELLKALDERYAKKEVVDKIQETVAPFTQFRRRLWGHIVTFVFTTAFLAIVYWEINKFNKGA